MKTLKTRKPRSFLSFSCHRFPLQPLADLYSLLHSSFKTFYQPPNFSFDFSGVCSSILNPIFHTCPLAGSWMIFSLSLFALLFNSWRQCSQPHPFPSPADQWQSCLVFLEPQSQSFPVCPQLRAHLPAGCCPRWPCEVEVALHSAEVWLPGGAAGQPSFLGIVHGHLLTSAACSKRKQGWGQIRLSLP